MWTGSPKLAAEQGANRVREGRPTNCRAHARCRRRSRRPFTNALGAAITTRRPRRLLKTGKPGQVIR